MAHPPLSCTSAAAERLALGEGLPVKELMRGDGGRVEMMLGWRARRLLPNLGSVVPSPDSLPLLNMLAVSMCWSCVNTHGMQDMLRVSPARHGGDLKPVPYQYTITSTVLSAKHWWRQLHGWFCTGLAAELGTHSAAHAQAHLLADK